MTRVSVVLTYEDYVALPNDGTRYEIHDGVLSVAPAPTFRHQQVLARLLGILRAHVTERDLGEVVPAPVTVVLAETTVVEPDIVYVAVLSPSTARSDRHTKKQLFERYEVPSYWIVDPDARLIEVYRLAGGAYGPPELRTSDLSDLPPFPGLSVDPAELWR